MKSLSENSNRATTKQNKAITNIKQQFSNAQNIFCESMTFLKRKCIYNFCQNIAKKYKEIKSSLKDLD